MNIIKYTSEVNTTYKAGRDIKYIVVHYTAGTSSRAGAALSAAKFFCGGTAGGSADFIVDDESVVQYNGDIGNRYCWSVGGEKYKTMSTSQGGQLYGRCSNINSVSVEICSNKTDKKSLKAADADWYFTDAALTLAAELVKKLMRDYGVSIERVVMHHHITGKICPNPWCVNESRLAGWEKFKKALQEDDEMVDSTEININGKNYTVSRIFKDGKNYICLNDLRDKGFNVGYNPENKIPSVGNKVKELAVKVNGEEKRVDAILIYGSNYVNLRSLAEAVGSFEVEYIDNEVVVNTK